MALSCDIYCSAVLSNTFILGVGDSDTSLKDLRLVGEGEGDPPRNLPGELDEEACMTIGGVIKP